MEKKIKFLYEGYTFEEIQKIKNIRECCNRWFKNNKGKFCPYILKGCPYK
jgi:hypothetical protein